MHRNEHQRLNRARRRTTRLDVLKALATLALLWLYIEVLLCKAGL